MPQKATELQLKPQLSVIWITHAVSCYIGRKQDSRVLQGSTRFRKVLRGSEL